MARTLRAALAVGATLAALVGGAGTAHAADKTRIQLETVGGVFCLGAGPQSLTYLDECGASWMFPAEWWIVPTAGSSFELRWIVDDDCLEVAGGGTQTGAQIRRGTCTGSKQTRWQLDLVDPVRKLYQVRPTHTANRCLDIPNGEVVKAKPLQSWSCNQSDAQLWRVKPIKESAA
ncbi:RICIN domain-containing protein [Streptomyces bacillaris]|uniref:RICIN domain-containing protein n=1 Tax=Streptomyces bacillaris TaxID=68179 RepID=UPI0013A6F494